jgi:hypothetical protein
MRCAKHKGFEYSTSVFYNVLPWLSFVEAHSVQCASSVPCPPDKGRVRYRNGSRSRGTRVSLNDLRIEGSSSAVVKRMNEQSKRDVSTIGQHVIFRVVHQGNIIRETNVTAAENAVQTEVLPRFFAYPQGTYVPLILENGVLPVWFSHVTAVDSPVTLLSTNQVYNGSKDVSLWKGERLCLLSEQELRLCLGRMVRVEVDPRRVPVSTWEQFMEGEGGGDADATYKEDLRRSFESGGIRDTHHYFLSREQVSIENWRAVEVWDAESRAWCALDGLLLFYKVRHLLQLQYEDLQISVVKLLDDLMRVHESRPKSEHPQELIAGLRAVQRFAAEKGDGALRLLTLLTTDERVRTFDELGLVLNEGICDPTYWR